MMGGAKVKEDEVRAALSAFGSAPACPGQCSRQWTTSFLSATPFPTHHSFSNGLTLPSLPENPPHIVISLRKKGPVCTKGVGLFSKPNYCTREVNLILVGCGIWGGEV